MIVNGKYSADRLNILLVKVKTAGSGLLLVKWAA
jgi:hypothetical protein